MLRYLLDTSNVIYAIKRRPPQARVLFNQHAGHVAISVVTLAELLHGVEKSSNPAANLAVVEDLCSRLDVLPYTTPDLHPSHAKRIGDVLVLHALRSQQHDTSALRQPDAGSLGPRQPRQLAFLLIRQINHRGYSQFTAPMQTTVAHWSEPLHLS